MRQCPLCNNSKNLISLWGTNIVRCPSCTLGYVRQLPTVAAVNELYSAEYFRGTFAYADYEKEKVSLQKNFEHRISVLRQFNPNGHLFEIGCAYGFFLELASLFWIVAGIDISETAVDHARNKLHLDVAHGCFETHPMPKHTYDVITMWDVIEHLYDPFLAMRKITEALRPGGIVAITTGDLDALLPRVQRKSWRLLHPWHLYYFSKNSITRLFINHGLSLVHFSHVSNYRSLRQMAQIIGHARERTAWQHTLVRQIGRLSFANLQVPLNLYDIMFAVAKKNES